MKLTQRTALAFLLLFIFSFRSKAQIAGTFSVPATFPTIAAAITTLNTMGVAGHVTIYVSAGYTETATSGGYKLYTIAGAASTAQVVFQKSGVGANPIIYAYTGGTATPASSVQDGVWWFIGADYVTVDGIDINDPNTSNPSTMEFGYGFYNANSGDGCQNNTIKNCSIILTTTNSASGSGLVAGGSRGIDVVAASYTQNVTALTPTSVSGGHSYNKFYSNAIQNCHVGIALMSSSSASGATGNDVGGTSAATGNTITNFGGGSGSIAYGVRTIFQLSQNVSNNVLINNNGTGLNPSNHLYAIRTGSGGATSSTVNNNTITLFSGATSTVELHGILNEGGANSGTIQINNNVFPSYSYSNGAADCSLIKNTSTATSTVSISNNSMRNLSVPNGYFRPFWSTSGGTCSINSNTFVNASSAAYFADIIFVQHKGAYQYITNNLVDSVTINYMSGTSSAINSTTRTTIMSNTFRNINCVAFKGIDETNTTTYRTFSDNLFYNINSLPGGGLYFSGISITGLSATLTINGNSIYSVTCSGTGTNVISFNGILVDHDAYIYNNKIAGVYSPGTGTIVGVETAGQKQQIYNNLIGDFNLTGSTNPEGLTGIKIDSYVGTNILYNSVYFNSASTGSNSGSTALRLVSTASLVVRNNIFVNTSVCTGTALTSAMSRGYSTPSTFSTTNNNLLYAGTPSANHVIFSNDYASTSSYSTLAAYKTLMYPAETQAVSENPPFLITSGTSSLFLTIDPTSPTQVEGLAQPISGYTTDYVGTTRNSTTPDIGAREGNYLQADVNTPTIVTMGFSSSACDLSGRTVTVNFSDASGVASGSIAPRLYYRLNFGLYSSVQGSLSSGTYSNGIWTFSLSYSGTTSDVIRYFFTVQDLSPLNNLALIPSAGGTISDVNNVPVPPTTTYSYVLQSAPTISVSNGNICSGSSFTINPTGASTYSITGGSFVVSPTITTSYSVTGTSTAGCISASAAVAIVTVQSSPTISINSGSICSGKSHTFTPGGADSYTITGSSFIVSPTANAFYTVTGTSTLAGCISAPVAATVEVYASPTVGINSGSICAGNVFTLSPTGASSYTVSGGSSLVSPLTNTFYTVTGSSTEGCVSVNTATATVTVAPLPTISANNGTICSGNSFTINPNGASTYTYSDGSAIVSPLTNTFYTISGTSSVGCVSASSATVNILVNASPTITANSGSICAGNTFTIIPSDGSLTYTYSGGSAVVSPVSSTLFTTVGTNSLGCVSNSATSNVTVHANPTITVNSGSICFGNSFTIAPGGGASYNISGGASVVSPVSNTVYLITGTSSVGCVSANTATATVTVAPLPTVSATNGTICSGKSFTINPNGASTYTYSGGSAVVSPVTNTFYTITGTSSVGCLSSNTATVNVAVQASPSITVNSGSICSGNSFTIIPSDGSLTYTYSGGSSIVSPGTTTLYTVAGSNSLGCVSNSATSNVTVNITPTITVNSGTLCSGSTFTINPLGADTYTVQGGSYIVSPSSNTSYTVAGSSLQGCVSATTALSSVTVIALPSVSVTSGSVCAGSVFTLNPSGAASYIYSSGSATVSPVNTSTYSVSGLSAEGCASSNTAIATVTVLTLPNLSISGNTLTCANVTQTLTVSGANTYTWMAAGNGSVYVVSPSATTSYSVVGSAANNCINSAQITIITNSLPAVSISGNATVCSGAAVNLNASGTAITFTWSNGTIGNLATFNPTLSSVITTTGTGANGCVNTASQVIFVNSLPPVVANADHNPICIGESVTLFGTGAGTYTWTGGVSDNAAFYPSVSNTYTVIGTDANACKNSSTISLVVNQLPQISINSLSPDTICEGDEIILVAGGGNFYSWTSGQQTSSVAVSPPLLNGYTVTGTDANGCKSQASYVQYVEECTGIAIKKIVSGMKIYPNPNNGVFYIELNGNATNLHMELVNVLGENILTKNLAVMNEISLKEKAKGIYFVRIFSGSSLLITEKIVVAE